jgi:hypothetical protein
MRAVIPLTFGTAEVARSLVDVEGGLLRLSIREGTLTKDKVRMMIDFLKAKFDQMDSIESH